MTWQRVLRVGGTVLLAGLSAFGAATLVVGFDLGFEAAIMAGIAAFFANVFMIDGLARDKVLRDRCRHYERNHHREPDQGRRVRPVGAGHGHGIERFAGPRYAEEMGYGGLKLGATPDW